jgi:CYTH domain-containing protein
MGGTGLEIERKYLIGVPPTTEVLLAHGAAPAELEQVYLVRDGGDPRRIRRIVRNDATEYVLTRKRSLGGIVRREIEHEIDAAEYQRLLADADPTRRPIRKTRWTWDEVGHTWELDLFLEPAGKVLLEVELSDPDIVVVPPSWIDVVRDVSTDPAYFNWSLTSIGGSEELPA